MFSRQPSPDGETPFHTNNMRFTASDAAGGAILVGTYYSVGGGFVVSGELAADGPAPHGAIPDVDVLPFPYRSADELLVLAAAEGTDIAGIVRRNERHWRTDEEIDAGLLRIWAAMEACIARGLREDGMLPGPLAVRRRAAGLHRSLSAAGSIPGDEAAGGDPLAVMDWVNLYALAVNEENAAGGRVVTAPTNGAAGIIPAVLPYYAAARPRRGRARRRRLPAHRGRDRRAVQGERLDLRRRGRLPGGGGRRLLDGRRGAVRGARRHAGAGRERGRDRDGAPPRAHLRSGRRDGPDPVHRAQRDRQRQGDQRRADGARAATAHTTSRSTR